MITVAEANTIIYSNLCPVTKSIQIPVQEATGFVLFKDVFSPINMPPFRQSAMDGYAVNVSEGETYTLLGEIKAGDNYHPILQPGEAVRIFTGAAVPDSANAVVMQEKVVCKDHTITIQK